MIEKMDSLFGRIHSQAQGALSTEPGIGTALTRFFLARSPLIVEELFPTLESELTSPSFQHAFLALFRRTNTAEKERLQKEVEQAKAAGSGTAYYHPQLLALDKKLAITTFDDYLSLLRDPAEGHAGTIELLANEYAYVNGGNDGHSYITEHYHIYKIGALLYEEYSRKASLFERFRRPYVPQLRAIYKKLDIDLPAVDKQFAKYDLLSLVSGLRIINGKESQSIIDDRVGLHYLLDVPRELLAALEDAIGLGLVEDIAFHIDGITDRSMAFEALEFGALFSFQTLRLPEMSKLFDEDCYDDALWIKVDKSQCSLTFEELCQDFPEMDGKVVTQVVHLEFFADKGRNFINHIDHEYILYTLDEYAERTTDSSMKGHDKLKTFKIDNARIPLDFRFNDRYFLFLVLDAYFKNKALIREYFAPAQSS